MASIPAVARKFLASLGQVGISVEHIPATSPGGSHEIYVQSLGGKQFTALVEKSGIAIWDTERRGGNHYNPEGALIEVIRIRRTQ